MKPQFAQAIFVAPLSYTDHHLYIVAFAVVVLWILVQCILAALKLEKLSLFFLGGGGSTKT